MACQKWSPLDWFYNLHMESLDKDGQKMIDKTVGRRDGEMMTRFY